MAQTQENMSYSVNRTNLTVDDAKSVMDHISTEVKNGLESGATIQLTISYQVVLRWPNLSRLKIRNH